MGHFSRQILVCFFSENHVFSQNWLNRSLIIFLISTWRLISHLPSLWQTTCIVLYTEQWQSWNNVAIWHLLLSLGSVWHHVVSLMWHHLYGTTIQGLLWHINNHWHNVYQSFLVNIPAFPTRVVLVMFCSVVPQWCLKSIRAGCPSLSSRLAYSLLKPPNSQRTHCISDHEHWWQWDVTIFILAHIGFELHEMPVFHVAVTSCGLENKTYCLFLMHVCCTPFPMTASSEKTSDAISS